MKNSKQSITFNVMLGYVLIATLAALAVWFIYSQVLNYTSMAENNIVSNKKLYLVGEAATNLYEAESLSRKVIQTGNPELLDLYKEEITTVRQTLDSLRRTYTDTILKKEVDSINFLLSQKTANLEELLQLRTAEGNKSYYSKVIEELQRVDENFEEPNYAARFKELEPHQRRVLIKLLEFGDEEENEEITRQTLDSLVNSVKTILAEMERADRRYRQSLLEKENELLANEVHLNGQLQNLLSTIEKEEREASLQQVEASQTMVRNTSQIIAVLGAISFLVILIFLFLVVRDVSRSQQYRKELENAKQYAESILKSKEQFMATVTHDLRSPLNTVVGYSNLLEKSELSKSQSHYLGQLKKSSDFILRLVNDLLDLSKLEAGKMSVEKLTFNPKNLIEDTVENAIPAEKKKALKVAVHILEELDRNIISDPFRIKQILINLITNAFKFTEKGTIEINAHLEVKNKNPLLSIAVSDTGIGIPKDKVEHIFEEFSQENNSIEKRFGGSGLGLAISKKLTQLLNGSIHLKSVPGKGSTFTLKIPIEYASEAEKPVLKPTFSPPTDLSRFRVLIVDDEKAQISLIREFMKSTGMQTEIAHHGKQAVEKLTSEKFDLVLTDIQMPEMDGFELLSYIRNSSGNKDIPVIALSGKPDTSAEEYSEKGFQGSLLKPYSPKDLIALIEKLLQVNLKKKTETEDHAKGSSNYSLKDVKIFAGGDKKALKIIITAFLESTTSNLDILRESVEKGEKDKIAAIAHKMLPMFRQLKSAKIVRKLADLELKKSKLITSSEFEKLAGDIQELMQELKQEIKV